MKSLLLFLLLLCSASVAAQEYVGSAPIEPGLSQAARRDAMADAEAQAGERNGIAIHALDDGTGTPRTSMQTGPRPLLERVDEWSQGQTLNVRARARADDCGNGYRRRVVAVRFPVLRPDQVRPDDFHGLEEGLPQELMRRLAATGDYLTRGVEPGTLYDPASTAPDSVIRGFDGRSVVVETGDRLGADLIVSGVVRDVGVNMPRYKLPDIGYLGWASRRVQIELFVHDGHTGALLLRHGYADEASGEVILDRNIPFASERFFESNIGQAFDRILRQAVAAMGRELKCLPFTTRIIRADGDELVLDAGADTRVKVGDVFVAYATARDQLRDRGGRARGPERHAVGQLTVTQVEADYAVARLTEGKPTAARLQAGDVASTR